MNPNPHLKTKDFVRVKMGQDTLFYGREFATEFLKDSPSIKIDWLSEEGDCLLKGQSCAIIEFSSTQDEVQIKDLIKVFAYLSGVATLTCCYIESAEDIKVVGSPSKNSSFNEWEAKIIQNTKGFIRPSLPLWLINSKEQLKSILSQKPNCIALNKNTFSEESLEQILSEIPEGVTKGVYGNLLPEDLEELSALPVDVCWPELLQGNFPSIKIEIHVEK